MGSGILFTLFLANVAFAAITTKGRNIIVNEGDGVELPCNVKDMEKDSVILWKREKEVIFMEETSTIDDPRIQLHRENDNFTLVIDRVEPYDTADYTCEITSPEMSITHHLQVTVHPSVSISPDANPLLVNVKDNVILKCSASGNPTPKVSWTRQGAKMPTRSVSKEGRLRIMNVSVEDSGIYECIASNNIGTDARDTIELRVQSGLHGSHEPSSPWVETDYTYLPVEEYQDVNISCKYDAEPSPQVDWLFNLFTINFSEEKFKGTVQYGARRENYSDSILAIHHITKDNFGDYTCRVSNNLGTVEKAIYVSGRPGPPILNVSGSTLSWSVQSKSPIMEYHVKYRLSDADIWEEPLSLRPQKEEQKGDIWTRSEDMRLHLKPNNNYDIQVQARNTLGWGSLARTYVVLKTPSVDYTSKKSNSVCRTTVKIILISAVALMPIL